MKYSFPVTRTSNPKAKPDVNSLGFGKYFTDHMFMMDYKTGEGWGNGRIVPYEKIQFMPASRVFHYGQEIFEGIKAYAREDGTPVIFRGESYMERMKSSAERMCVPEFDTEMVFDAIKQLVEIDKDWIPEKDGASLYIRPFTIAMEQKLSVGPSNRYHLVIILSPVDSYYDNGMKPTKILVEEKYIRSVFGGPGHVKVGANYASTFISIKEAQDEGYDQVLWLDGKEKKYIEEIGTSNIFFVIDDEVITPPLEGTILPGVTRNSAMVLLNEWGYTVKEDKYTIEEFAKAYDEGRVKEVFATGTAAVVSPVGELCWREKKMIFNNGETGAVSQRLFDELTGIHSGRIEDTRGWIVPVK